MINYIRSHFCRHKFERTGESRFYIFFSDDEWGCAKCGWKVHRFTELDPNDDKLVGRRNK